MIINFANLGGGGGGGYVLPVASQSTLGGVKVGEGLSIDSGGTLTAQGGDNIYYVDGDSISNYSGVVDEVYHKLSSGETVFASGRYDYYNYQAAKAEIYEYQEGSGPEDPEYLRHEGFKIPAVQVRPADGRIVATGYFSAFHQTGRDGESYNAGFSVNDDIRIGTGLTYSNGYLSVSGGATVQYLTEDTWTGAYWEIGTELPEGGSWGVSIRRPDYTEIFETYHRLNEAIVMGEGNLGNTGSREGNLTITDENEHIILDGQGNRYVFRMDFANGVLYFYHSPDQTGNFTYEGAQGKSYTTGSTEGTVHLELAKVLSGSSWIQKDEILFPKTYFIDNMTTEERVALYNYIKYSGPKVSPISKFCRFFSTVPEKDGFMGMCEVYFCRFDSSGRLSFSGNAMSRNSNVLVKVKLDITNEGSIYLKTITDYSLTVSS
ncbi:hypothetical protein [Fibrobacter sp.]|uniref:hypothetical protein n=1 Tax=Fibrobacter sp. TaxID=35828 RepID=UPI003864765C